MSAPSTPAAPLEAGRLPKLPAGIGPMPDEQRQRIEFLATHILEEYSGQGWQARHLDRSGVVSVRSDATLLTVNPNFGPTGRGLLLDFVAAMDPETALATLAYVRWLEQTNDYLMSSTVSQHVYTAATDSYVAALEAERARAHALGEEVAGLRELLAEAAPYVPAFKCLDCGKRIGKIGPHNCVYGLWGHGRVVRREVSAPAALPDADAPAYEAGEPTPAAPHQQPGGPIEAEFASMERVLAARPAMLTVLTDEALIAHASRVEPGTDEHHDAIMEICNRGLVTPAPPTPPGTPPIRLGPPARAQHAADDGPEAPAAGQPVGPGCQEGGGRG